jgi:hypothetical protein
MEKGDTFFSWSFVWFCSASSTVDLCGEGRYILSVPHKPWSHGPKQAVFVAVCVSIICSLFY